MLSINSRTKLSNAALLCLASALLQGCSQKIDARQVHVEQGLIYKKDASDPFTGKLINLGIAQLGQADGFQLLPSEGSCTVTVKDGVLDGSASCENANGKKVAEVAYSQGRQDGKLKVWEPDTGKLILDMTFRGGLADGLMERYSPQSGKVISHVNFEAGKKVGDEKHWDITGETLLTEMNWQNGAPTGVYRFGGQEEHYKSGKLDGIKKFCTWTGPREKLYASQNPALKYGGTFYIPAITDQPTDFSCTETVYKDGVEQSTAVASSTSASQPDACLNSKIAAFRKENGEEAPIIDDVIQEWKAGCNK